MQRSTARPMLWRGYTAPTERQTVYSTHGYPVGQSREYPFGSGVAQEGPVETVESPLTPNGAWTSGGGYRTEAMGWRPSRERPHVGQPVTLTVKPPRSRTVYTIQQGVGAPPMPALPKQPQQFRPTREPRRSEPAVLLVERPRKRLKEELPNTYPKPRPPYRPAPLSVEATEEEPGEIVERQTQSIPTLQWCTNEQGLAEVGVSLRGRLNRERCWTAEGFILRESQVPHM